jgi:hypothetical protein
MRVEKRDEEAAINGESKEEATEGVKRDEKARRGREEGWGSRKRGEGEMGG